MNSINEKKNENMLYVSFNQDGSFFVVGTDRGFRIYNTYPFEKIYQKDMDQEIIMIEMLYKTNILAFMEGDLEHNNEKKIIIWDDMEEKIISELRFITKVLRIKIKKDFLFILCRTLIFVFDFNTFELLEKIETGENEHELIAVNSSQEYTVLAYPKKDKDMINNTISVKNYKTKTIFAFHAQEDSVTYLSMNSSGTYIATSNKNGTIIRIHSGIDGYLLKEFKRGSEKAIINYICFDNDSKFMAVCSDKGTIHIFSMGSTMKEFNDHQKRKGGGGKDIEEDEDKLPQNPQNYIEKIIYPELERSFAKVRLEPQDCICAFGPNDILVILTNENKYYNAKINTKKSGDCQIIFEKDLI
jgi:WD40 repeat protein